MHARFCYLAGNALIGSFVSWQAPDGTPSSVALVGCLPLALAFGQDRPDRWHPPGSRVAGVLLSSLGLWLLLLLAWSLNHHDTLLLRPWALPAYFIPAHLAAHVVRRFRPRRPLRLRGTGRLRRPACLALDQGWGHGWRIATSEEEAPSVIIPHGHWADRSLFLETPTGPLPLHPLGPETPCQRRLKRGLDLLLLAALALPVAGAWWLLALVAVFQQGGPIHYRQVRWTRSRRPFPIHKIRTMRRDAESPGEAVWPREGDPRITPLGRRLRHLWLDEIPQAWNVLLGQMSWVGPRPERPEFAAGFARRLPIYHLRFQTPAGVTGLAQVRGYHGDTSIARRARWDARYVARWSPCLDLQVLAATAALVVRRSRRGGGRDGQGRRPAELSRR